MLDLPNSTSLTISFFKFESVSSLKLQIFKQCAPEGLNSVFVAYGCCTSHDSYNRKPIDHATHSFQGNLEILCYSLLALGYLLACWQAALMAGSSTPYNGGRIMRPI